MIKIFKLKFDNKDDWEKFQSEHLSNVEMIGEPVHPIDVKDNLYHVDLIADVEDNHILYQYIDPLIQLNDLYAHVYDSDLPIAKP